MLKNVYPSNNLRVSKREVKSFSNQYVLDGSIQNTCIWCIIIWRNAKEKQFLDLGIIFIVDVFYTQLLLGSAKILATFHSYPSDIGWS